MRGFKRLLRKTTDSITHMRRVFDRVFKILVKSAIIFYPVVSVFALLNLLLGVHISYTYYFILSTLVTIVMTILSCIFEWKNITAKPPKPSRRRSAVRSEKRAQSSVNRKRRKIS